MNIFVKVLVGIIMGLIFNGCVKSTPLDVTEAKYATATELSHLTNLQFSHLTFMEGVESKYAGGIDKEYKVVFASPKEKDQVVSEIGKILGESTEEWEEGDAEFTFSKYLSYKKTSFLVTVRIPKGSNDTIYIRERMVNESNLGVERYRE